jgi:hypothetical protein
MSFISIGDIISISQLVGNLLSRVRTAAAEFRVFAGDLNLTQTILRQLQSNWGILASRLGESERNTIRSIFKGIRRGLNELENQLERYQNVGGIRHGIANLRFSNHLADLQRRLQFHMSALQLLAQNLSIMQGNRIEEALRVFREALEEQRRSDQQERGLQPGEQEWQENMHAFQMHYVHYPREVRAGRAMSSTSSDSRSYLIEKWRHEVTEAESSNNTTSPEPAEPTIVGSETHPVLPEPMQTTTTAGKTINEGVRLRRRTCNWTYPKLIMLIVFILFLVAGLTGVIAYHIIVSNVKSLNAN